jgi:serine/threonine protein kinase
MAPDAERCKQIDRILRQALSQAPEDLKSFLDRACTGDGSLRLEVEQLLLHRQEAENFLETPALQVAAKALAEDSKNAPAPDLAGRLLSHYRILEKVGEGGMGVVYRAHDEHLMRDVAVKVLPPGTLNDESARKRFRKEALALSRLNYPNIGTVHDFDTRDGIDFLVMEYVEGTTLKDRLVSGPLPGDEVLRLGEQLAEGLQAAHAKGIIHRDLKPGNLILTKDGRLKILDFGLAKLFQPSSEFATTESLSETHTAAGTLPYMSPEQLRGQSVDVRSDLFSFGAVLYEMATGKRAFSGNTPAMLCDAILNKTPTAPTRLNPDVPIELERIITKALEKDPRNRYQSAKEIRAELHHCSTSSVLRGDKKGWFERFGTARSLPWALLIAIAFLTLTWLWIVQRQGSVPEYELSQITRSGWASEPAVSPDGNLIAYTLRESGNRSIWLTDLLGKKIQRLTDDPAENSSPAWFPDQSAIAFVSDRSGRTSIWKVGVSGGPPSLLVPDAKDPAVSPDRQSIAFARRSTDGEFRIWVASLSNPESDVRMLTDNKKGLWDHASPAWSPDSKEICYATRHGLWIVSVKDGLARRLTSDNELDFEPAWDHRGGHIYFSSYRGGVLAIWRVKPQGGKVERVTQGQGPESHPSLPWDGKRLVHSIGKVNQECVLLNVRSGEQTVFDASESVYYASIGADGTKVVFASRRGRAGPWNLWLQEIDRGTPSSSPKQLTYFPDIATKPALSPDNQWIAFYRIIRGQRDVYIVPISGGEATRFTDHQAADIDPAWSPDGSKLAFASERAGGRDIWIAPVKDGRPSGNGIQLTTGPVLVQLPDWSSDGTRIAFTGSVGDRSEAWWVPAQGGLRAQQITDGAEVVQVRWDPNPASGDVLVSASWGTDRVTLWKVSPQTRVRQPFAPPVEFGEKNAQVGMFSLSHDGLFLVYARGRGGKGQICSLEAQNGVF